VKRILQPAEGEVLKLGPPAAGEIIIKVDSRQAGTSFAAGTETLLPGAEIPSHRHLHQDEVLFIYKGQGRSMLDGQAMTVLPGTMVFAPKGSWHSLRNTGTGLLQLAWLSSPGGIEPFFRELAQAGAAMDAAAFKQAAERIELGAATAEVLAPESGRRHRRRRGRGQGGAGRQPAPQAPGTPQPQSADVAAPVQHAAGQPAPQKPVGQGGGRRRRRHGRGGSGRPTSPQASPGTGPVAAPVPAVAKTGVPRAPRSSPRQEGRRGRPRRFGRVKEVYMGGKWVRVTGEGPVISGEASSENKEELDA
jgi:quercetin dioxygenase-like cupin family protein